MNYRVSGKIARRQPGTLFRLMTNLEGATAVEYCFIGALIAAGLAAGIGTLSDTVLSIFEMLGPEVDAAGDGG
ncbi:Flp family type IVb pilin [Kordiimonas sp.]|uniref:Flp family type IVb pilin n=1 Tax=Kordiimonas sp. TaxID=1970157 RepID=UPI003A9582E7